MLGRFQNLGPLRLTDSMRLLFLAYLAASVHAAEKLHPPRQALDSSTNPPLPLTTTFTPPANCFADVSLFSGYGYPTSYSVGVGVGNQFESCTPCWLGLATTSTCFPSAYSSAAVYSPGTCPQGYWTACTSVTSVSAVTKTVATCCPR
jgi:hypothetical protein